MISAAAVAAALSDCPHAVAERLLGGGKLDAGAWRAGSKDGEAGQSLIFHLRGERAGRWHDFSTGEDGDALDLFVHHFGGYREGLEAAAAFVGITDDPVATIKRPTPRQVHVDELDRLMPDRAAENKIKRALDYWARSLPLAGTLAEVYLHSRCCPLPPADGHLRFLPAISEYGFSGPAMVALVTDALDYRRELALHVTWLNPDGSGRGERRPIGATKGGVIRLWPDEEVELRLGLAEGIETSLMCSRWFTPIWSTIDAGHMRAFPVLAGIESLTLFADNDPSGTGLAAASACRDRWLDADVRCRIILPPTVGNDWADEVTTA